MKFNRTNQQHQINITRLSTTLLKDNIANVIIVLHTLVFHFFARLEDIMIDNNRAALAKANAAREANRLARNPCDKRLTPKEELFAQTYAEGGTQVHALTVAYPSSKKWDYCIQSSNAFQIFNKPHVRKRYLELRSEINEAAVTRAKWSREDAIHLARTMAELALKEWRRLDEAHEEAVEMHLKDFYSCLEKNNTEKAQSAMVALQKAKKQTRIPMPIIQAITNASELLIKVQGYANTEPEIHAHVHFGAFEEALED